MTSSGRAKMPFADLRITKYLTNEIESSSKSQRQIAKEIGYDTPQMISMIKRGETKVPFEKIPALAESLNVDVALLYRMAIEDYQLEQRHAVGAIFGTVLTKNETKILDAIREETKGTRLVVTPALLRKIKAVFEK